MHFSQVMLNSVSCLKDNKTLHITFIFEQYLLGDLVGPFSFTMKQQFLLQEQLFG